MIHAYNELYLEQARVSLGTMFDFAVEEFKMTLDEFYEKFLASSIARRMEVGDSSTIAGKSGIELAYEVVDPKEEMERKKDIPLQGGKSPEYWTGWALGYFQWYSALKYSQIQKNISINEIKSMYHPYHEMDILQFADTMIGLYNQRKGMTNLKQKRMAIGLSQHQLAELSGVPVRTIQQYEQGRKNINRAAVEYVVSLSNAVHCNPQDLIEIEPINQ